VDGRIIPADAPGLLASDRGFLLGDGVFETLRARRGVAIDWEDHAARLHESAAALAIVLPFADQDLLAGLTELLRADGLDDAAVRITVSRGPSAGRGLLPAGWRTLVPTVVIAAWPQEPPSTALLERGVHAIVSSLRRDPASPLAGVKSISRADHVYARLEAERAGADDALLLTLDGRLSESTTANVWLVSGDRLRTPGLDAAILAGTTRAWLLAEVPLSGIGVVAADEVSLTVADLLAADEAFLSSSVAGIVPLTAVDRRAIGSGSPGPLTLAVRAARERWIDEQATSP
jgi:branched-subunit amino acid aminotransferase/4-amino-4-deoxychorismate lyase